MSLLSHDTTGLTFAEACDAAMGARAMPASPESIFPLWRKVQLRSDLGLAFQAQEFTAGSDTDWSSRRELVVGFLTLAGWDGYLPEEVGQEIQWNTLGEGDAYHAFLDVLNRRFWELQYSLQCMASDLAAPMSLDASGWIDVLPAICGTAADFNEDIPWLQSLFAIEGGGLSQDVLNESLCQGSVPVVRVRSHELAPIPLAGHARLIIGDRLGVPGSPAKCLGANSPLPVQLGLLIHEPPLDGERSTTELAATVNRLVGSVSCTTSYRFTRAYVDEQALVGDKNCRLGLGGALRTSATLNHILSCPRPVQARFSACTPTHSQQLLDCA